MAGPSLPNCVFPGLGIGKSWSQRSKLKPRPSVNGEAGKDGVSLHPRGSFPLGQRGKVKHTFPGSLGGGVGSWVSQALF